MSKSKSTSKMLHQLLLVAIMLSFITPRGSTQAAPLPPAKSFAVAPGRAAKLTYEGATLDIGPDAVAAPLAISITPLADQDLAALDQGMFNTTTGPRRGYRFLPHGMRFKTKITISVPYTADQIPTGLTAQDLYTFYFDDQAGSWQPLERVKVDPQTMTVVSLSDHFTDMINAAVTVPDHPETLAYSPTSIKDIKAADPGAGINLIAPPQANNTGDARLSYPIEGPPGRNGMQPSLGIAYNSSGGNGWMGVGWDLAAPAIMVDTRWGVPRYDSQKETETYLLNGEQLTPVAYRGELPNRTTDKVFHTRVEGQFQRIIRHGDQPATYWWEVIDKNGTRYVYGDNPAENLPQRPFTLRDGKAHIFRWAMREVRDLNGNGMTYTYDRPEHTGLEGGTVPGYQLYLKSINYTRANGAAGAYTITFKRDRELPAVPNYIDPTTGVEKHMARPDVTIDTRGGFKMVTAELLKRIEITFNEALVRQYDFIYQEGAFKKTLLASITQRGEDQTAFHAHTFTYHAEQLGFDTPTPWNTGSDTVTAPAVHAVTQPPVGDNDGQASALSGSISNSVGGHAYVGFNPGAPTKQGSLGAKVGFNYSNNEGVMALIDINGDGLPDKVFCSDWENTTFVCSDFAFRLNQSGPSGTTTFGPATPLGVAAISKETSLTASVGLEAYFGVNAFGNLATTFTSSSVYFSDVNSDGLPDLVNNGRVLFNYLAPDPADPNPDLAKRPLIPTFDEDDKKTPVPIGPGAVNTTALAADYQAIADENAKTFPLHDTLRRWVAPYAGQIRITGTVALLRDSSAARSQYQTADGVRVAIQHDGGELWSSRIHADDYAPKTPTSVDTISVAAGDRIYFRVQSVSDGAYDQVQWDPEIVYLGVPDVRDVNGLNPYRFKASDDFVLAGRRDIHVNMPLNGTIRLVGDLHKHGKTTDDVTVLVLKNDQSVFTQKLAWDQEGPITMPTEDIAVTKDDKIQLRVQVDSPIDLRQIAWTPSLFYTTTDANQPLTKADGTPLIQLSPPYDIDMYPVTDRTAPPEAWAVPQTGTLTVLPQVAAVGPGVNGTVTFTVKRRGELVAKQGITITNGQVQDSQLTITATAGDELYFDYAAATPELRAQLVSRAVEVTYEDPTDPEVPRTTVPSTFSTRQLSNSTGDLYAQSYRGWSYVGYNGNPDRDARPIDEALLVFKTADYGDKDHINEECTQDIPQDGFSKDRPFTKEDFTNAACNPATETAYLFMPYPAEAAWRGPDTLGWIKENTISSSRLGADTITIPQGAAGAGARAVNRVSHTTQVAVGAGVVGVQGSISGVNPLPGESYSAVDYLDLNGDRFPDIVGNGQVQYSMPDGSIAADTKEQTALERVRESDSSAINAGIGGTPASFDASALGLVNTPGPPKENTTGTLMVSLGVSAGLGGGESVTRYDLIDINGDGLPDRVSREDTTGDGLPEQLLVALNLGYTFAAPERWGDVTITSGASENGSIGASLGFNLSGIYDYAGGVSLSKNKSYTTQTLIDMNGDGLLDSINPNGERFSIAINTGNGFTAPITWTKTLPSGICRDTTMLPNLEKFGLSPVDWNNVGLCDGTTSFGGGVYFTVGIPLCVFACYLIINPGADVNQSMARQEAALRDVDGDGYPDHIASTHDGSMQVARNRTGRTNLLQSVKRPLGATIGLEYQRDGNTYDQPNSRWVLSKVTLNDGHAGDGVDTQVTTYRYEAGRYNRLEREFYGYGKVIEEHRDAANGEKLYRALIREFLNDSFYTKGLLKREQTQDAAGHLFAETEHTYLLRDIATGTELADRQSTMVTVFPELHRTDQRFYEGNATPGKVTYTAQQYDALGNVTRFVDAGDAGTQDDVTATLRYAGDSAACRDRYIVGTPTNIVVNTNGAELRRREATIDCATGNVTQVRQFLTATDAAVTDLTYFDNGNLRTVTGPANKNQQRATLTYAYDDVVQTHVTKVTDNFNLSSSATYDFEYGVVATSTDTNGNQISYTYDAYGRVERVTGPYDQGSTTPTIRFEYHPEAEVPWALTKHRDSFRSATDTIDTVLFTDGLKRVIQAKKDATIHTGGASATQDVMTVSGRAIFDFVGRTIEQFYPVTEPTGTPAVFNRTKDTVLQPTSTAYDILDRATKMTLPDSTFMAIAYGFGNDRAGTPQFATTTTDAKGGQKKTYHDVKELITSVEEFHTPAGGTKQSIWTSYAYDPLGQVVEVKDDKNNVTKVAYDNLGRRTSIDNPDTGKVETVYDLASNVIAKITPNLRAEHKEIRYDYDFTRLKSITYPNSPGNNVTYTYGAAGASENRVGRIIQITDESGKEERFYGKLGEVIKDIKTVASDTGPKPEVYTTEYTYDTLGRLQRLVYPDGEVLIYQYDAGGLVQKVVGKKGSTTYDYIRRLEYDKFEQRAFMEAGNGVRTQYSYRPDNRRLQNLQAGLPGSQFQNLSYNYDAVGNITQLKNDVPLPKAGQFGGPVTQDYTYDDLYRLTSASGTYQFMKDKTNSYRVSQSYDTIHNIRSKQQTHNIVQPSGVAIEQKKTSYTWTYSYEGAQPHAPTHIGNRTFSYDANGNQAGWTHDQNGTRRNIVWDEENRIQSVFDNGHEKTYKYDHAGERVTKRGPQGETAYVNQFFSIRNRTIGTKHVFVGSTRLVSKLMKADGTVEKDRYFFHGDHLGSSNYVTDANGALYQHLEYFPSGETWVEEATNTQRAPYLFTGKELDEETGLYYYGARYYDPRAGQFISADPLLLGNAKSSLDNPKLLSAYAYAYHNPLIYVDPTGLVPVPTRVEEECQCSLPSEHPSPNLPATIATSPVTDRGKARAQASVDLVTKLGEAGTEYGQPQPRDWDDLNICDCSKFTQLALEAAGEGELFGRNNATTETMKDKIEKEYAGTFRLTDPKPGDIMMWRGKNSKGVESGHIALVAEVVRRKDVEFIVYANMGNSGANLIGLKNGQYWLKVTDIPNRSSALTGGTPFLGFWTPK